MKFFLTNKYFENFNNTVSLAGDVLFMMRRDQILDNLDRVERSGTLCSQLGRTQGIQDLGSRIPGAEDL